MSWPEALAYCDWLNDMLSHSQAFDHNEMARLVREQGWRVALPSELEWEKAARGGLQHSVFTWGDAPEGNRANSVESEIGDTSVVGCFPANGFGLHDMLGNVWEWTRSRFEGYPYRPDDGRETNQPGAEDWLVVRGGSWGGPRDDARCAFRFRNRPDGRGYGLGFRVVLRAAPVS